MVNNPFDITKAVDYTDEQIYRYWVDLAGDGRGFEGLIEPESLTPKIIIGSKGSGKTHIMKYFSYELQKIRCERESVSLQEGLAKEKFIGVYFRCSGFNSDKFSGKGVDNDKWSILYAYFWELWVGERIVNVLADLKENGCLGDIDESSIVKEILGKFLSQVDDITTFKELGEYLLTLQKGVDYEVQNFLFDGETQPKVKILLGNTALTYGIPEIIKAKIPFFKNKYILYLIDELENFSTEQQQLIQTLIREKPVACTFRIGSRPYGVRTLKTLKGVEENHDGSEFKGVVLDEFLRNYKDYPQYIERILVSRLQKSELSLERDWKLENLIEKVDTSDIVTNILARKDSLRKAHLNKLRSDLLSRRLPDGVVDRIMCNMEFDNDIIIERTNVFLLYCAIKDNNRRTLLEEAELIAQSAKEYYESHNQDTLHAKKLDYFKKDMIDSLCRSANVDIPYYGLETLIELSCGTPRTILNLLKAAFSNQYFDTSKVPFEGNRKLTIKAQKKGIDSTYDWFFEENRIPTDSDKIATDAIVRIGDYLRERRFSDCPPECNIGIFSLNPSDLSQSARATFKSLLSYSYIIPTVDRRQKNSESKSHVYKLNSILVPKYELALGKRGNLTITAADAELIFNLEKGEEYKKALKQKIKAYNYPFNTAKASDQGELFSKQ